MLSNRSIDRLKKKYSKKDKKELRRSKAELYKDMHDAWKNGSNLQEIELEYKIVCEQLNAMK